VPQQALFLMNSPLVIEQVRNVVNRDAFTNASSDEDKIRFLYNLFFQRLPTTQEISNGTEFVSAFRPDSAAVQPAPAGNGARGAAGARGAQGRGGQAQVQGRGAQAGAQGRGRGALAAAPVRVPLSAWQEYAHALLMTNEAAFVN